MGITMAFVFKNPNTRYWLAGFRDINGKRRNRSTKLVATEKNKRQAEKIAAEYEAAANRRKTSQQVRRTIADLHRELTGEDLPTVTVTEHVAKWIASKAPSVSAYTKVFYEGATRKFLDHLGSRSGIDLAEVTRDDIERFRDSMAGKLAAKTVNHNVKVIKMLFRDARARVLIVDDPTEHVQTVKAERSSVRRPFTLDEVSKILNHCDAEWRSMVLFGLYTGQRLGDIARLKWDSIDLRKGVLALTTSKTGKRLNLPLHEDLIAHLKSLPKPIEKSLPIHPGAAAIIQEQERTALLSNTFGRILTAAGFREKRSHQALGEGRSGKREKHELSFHCLRRTATTLLHEAGVPQAVAMALIGHDSEEIHSIYVNVGEVAMRDAAGKLPSVSGRNAAS